LNIAVEEVVCVDVVQTGQDLVKDTLDVLAFEVFVVNILVSTSAPNDSAFSRYSNLVTPPSTPPVYTVKIADFFRA
jgi:hypothetical protein